MYLNFRNFEIIKNTFNYNETIKISKGMSIKLPKYTNVGYLILPTKIP